MKTITFINLTAALMLAALANLAAQQALPIGENTRVRVTVSTAVQVLNQLSAEVSEKFVGTETVIGTVAELTADTLKLKIAEKPALLAIPLASIKKLEISRGHIPRGKNVLQGAGVGLLIGGGIGVLVGTLDDPPSSYEMTTSDQMLLGGAVGGGTGLMVGSIVGASRGTERWEKIPLETLRAGLSPRDD